MEINKKPGEKSFLKNIGSRVKSRREFLRESTFAASAMLAAPAVAGAIDVAGSRRKMPFGKSNSMPGRIVLLHDDRLSNGSTVDMDRAAFDVAQGVKLLTGIEDTGEAFESLFPGITPSSTIAIKVNLIAWTDTRWETARGVVAGLAEMFGGTYDVSNVILFDRHSMSSHGYTAARFTFNGKTARLKSSSNCNSNIYPVPGRELSCWIADSDYLIDMPVLKDHSTNGLTLALKNHYGSVQPPSLCGQFTNMLLLNSHAEIKDKTCLVLMDCIFGLWTGGPHGTPQEWQTFPEERTPNSMLISTDPVTNEYYGRLLINLERSDRGYSTYSATYIETASGDPYSLGIADPGSMDPVEIILDRIRIELLSSPSTVARGEMLSYDVRVTNTDSSEQADLDRVRLEVTGPIAATLNIFSNTAALQPGQSVTDTVEVMVPGNTPLGEYNLETIVSFLGADIDSCSFNCEVTG